MMFDTTREWIDSAKRTLKPLAANVIIVVAVCKLTEVFIGPPQGWDSLIASMLTVQFLIEWRRAI